ncbi:MAG TPA: glutamate--tRNA ligase [Deltaproteobacteria bacterium]|nr:MAG: glutamate--tRNA ligase [Deltaproteobacteria bacterium GWA2_45_12]HBF11966.1 glutamate--tRNA ligase [Deltaproteobacteria bacterium]
MASLKPRLRFAPSPTGYLHIGGARTALYNYLLAKKWGGTFILRIEDTDLERSTPESVQAILDGMNWLGLIWDEGPYFQTKRFDLYKQHIDKLISEKKAYPCFCTAEDLTKKREAATAAKCKPMYDRTCLKLSADEVKKRLDQKLPHCIRFISPDEGEIVIKDVIKGDVVVANKELDDLIIARTNGSPTYNFTVVVDDVTMGITHVIRGDDHLNNTPRQIQLYQAFGYPLPIFAHVPMILGADKKRLSKRHGATSVMAYKDMGYLPEALVNYLVRLGWSYKDQEIFTRQELIEAFSLENCSRSAGVFNPEKLLWLNGVYIRQEKPETLAELVLPFLKNKGIENISNEILLEGIKISQEKVKTIVEFVEMVDFFFREVEPDEKLKEKFFTDDSKKIMKQIADRLNSLQTWTHETISQIFSGLVSETGLGLGKIAQPVRVALTGRSVSPGVFEIIRILGKEKTLTRILKYL